MEGLTMTTTENTRETQIVFRNKFEKLIQCDCEHQVFEEAFEKFFALKPEEALDMLWKLTCAPAITILEKIGLYDGISDEMFVALRNELRHQYKEMINPEFLKIDVPENCQEAFDALKNKSDSIVAAVVYEHCLSRLYVDEYTMNRRLFLLKSDKENNNFGGIRTLGFNTDESAYLKQFHEQIHDLLIAMYDNYQKQCGTASQNNAFAGLDKILEESGIDLPFDMGDNVGKVTQPAIEQPEIDQPETKQPAQSQDNPAFKSLNAEEIMVHKDAFASFAKDYDLNILVQIGQLGFDLNEVMAKKDTISNLLKAIESLEKAEAKVLAAAKTKEKAEAKLLKAAEALSK